MILLWELSGDDNTIEYDGNNDDCKFKLRAAANRTRHSTIESSVSTRSHQTAEKVQFFGATIVSFFSTDKTPTGQIRYRSCLCLNQL